MADRARLTVADHALIHLTGYLCLQPREDATWTALQAELAAVLPLVSRHLPAINRLAEAAPGLLGPRPFRAPAARALAAWHAERAAAAIDAMRAPEETRGGAA